jgi:hypothetical protein
LRSQKSLTTKEFFGSGKPLVLMPSLDEESQQWMVLEEPELNIL